jgi:hypothetical protein
MTGPQLARTRTATSAVKPSLDLLYSVAPHTRLGGAPIGRRGVAGSGGRRVVGASAVGLGVGDDVRLEQAGASGCQDDRCCRRCRGRDSVEVALPEGRSCLQLCCSGWSWVAGLDAVGGSPHRDFTDDGEVRLAAGRRPDRLGFVLAGVSSDPIGEVGN